MKLEEAIEHLEETLNNPEHEWSCAECKAEHEQLLEWLKDYKRLLERPQGEWLTRTEDNGVNYRFYCSCCNREVLLITDYCPYCGARMNYQS